MCKEIETVGLKPNLICDIPSSQIKLVETGNLVEDAPKKRGWRHNNEYFIRSFLLPHLIIQKVL